jgi:hypothetical protein
MAFANFSTFISDSLTFQHPNPTPQIYMAPQATQASISLHWLLLIWLVIPPSYQTHSSAWTQISTFSNSLHHLRLTLATKSRINILVCNPHTQIETHLTTWTCHLVHLGSLFLPLQTFFKALSEPLALLACRCSKLDPYQRPESHKATYFLQSYPSAQQPPWHSKSTPPLS